MWTERGCLAGCGRLGICNSKMEEEQQIFEQEEVVWAKIRGYPWWPAFVHQVHGPEEDPEFTVVFFGDNTNSRLDASKLRKFAEHYSEYYAKAKHHRKLMGSIMMAEEKLRQNDQNVEIYEELRTRVLNKKRPGRRDNESEDRLQPASPPPPPPHSVPESLVNEQEGGAGDSNKMESESKRMEVGPKRMEVGESVEEKTCLKSCLRAVDIVIEVVPEEAQSQHQSPPQQKPPSPKTRRSRRKDRLPVPPPEAKPKTKIQVEEPELPRLSKLKTEPVEVANKPDSELVEPESLMEPEESQEECVPSRDREVKRTVSVGQQVVPGCRPSVPIRRRGRPPKKAERDSSSEGEQPQEQGARGAAAKQKPIRKGPARMSLSEQAVVAGAERLLHNREGLISFLLRSSITVDNVKEILDMDVSNILQEGVITERVLYLLELLRAALLFKYFPDDVKHKKKYERLARRRTDSDPPSHPLPALPSDKRELRRKTALKVRKFLGGADQEEAALEAAGALEEAVFEADPSVGSQYCRVAFAVLSALKDKKDAYTSILRQLQKEKDFP